jgi:hypothetical protein
MVEKISMSVEETLELDYLIEQINDDAVSITNEPSDASTTLNYIKTKSTVFDPSTTGTYELDINNQTVEIEVTDIPISDDFQDGSISSFWDVSRPSSTDESADNLTVTYSDHHGDTVPLSGNSWELVFQEGDVNSFRVEAHADNPFDGTQHQKAHIGIEGYNGTRWAGGWSDEGADTFRGFEANEYVGGSGPDNENVERDAGAETSDELWIRLDWDGTDFTLYTERGSSFSSWNLFGTETPSGFTAPIKIGVVGNNNTISWREFSAQ